MSTYEDFNRFLKRTRAPVTIAIVAVIAVLFVLQWAMPHSDLSSHIAFTGLAHPLGMITYPFAAPPAEFVWLILLLWWLWMVGTGVERDMGSVRYLVFFFAATLIGAVSILIGAKVSHNSIYLQDLIIPLACITVAWSLANPSSTILLMFFLPAKAIWMAWISAGIVLFDVGQQRPVEGIFALIPLGLTYLLVTNRLPIPYTARAASLSKDKKSENLRSARYYDDVRKREQNRNEQEKLRKLFERSALDDNENTHE